MIECAEILMPPFLPQKNARQNGANRAYPSAREYSRTFAKTARRITRQRDAAAFFTD
jgi:hypothetical protein